MVKKIVTLISIFLFFATTCMGQYKVGDYYVKGDVKGIVFFVNTDEGVLYLLKTEMETIHEDVYIGDDIEWRDMGYVEQIANEPYDYRVWDRPNVRIARLIRRNEEIISQTCVDLGYKRLPSDCFLSGKVGSNGYERRIPYFYTRYEGYPDKDGICEGDYGYSESYLLVPNRVGILLYGIVDYRTGTLQKLW